MKQFKKSAHGATPPADSGNSTATGQTSEAIQNLFPSVGRSDRLSKEETAQPIQVPTLLHNNHFSPHRIFLM